MKSFRYILPGLLHVACASEEQRSTPEKEWRSVGIEHAQCFELLTDGTDHRLIVFSGPDTADTLASYFLSGGGSSTSVPIPVERMVVLSTTHIPYLSALDALDAVVGASYTNQLMDSMAIAAVRSGNILEVSRGEGPDLETLIALDPQVVTCYPFGGDGNLPSRHATASYVQVAEYLEVDPLGRAEWIKVFGVLTDKLPLAEELFKRTEQRYHEAKSLVKATTDRPGVFFGSSWQGQWYAPGGDSYMARLIEDAGGGYLFADRAGGGNLTISFEELYDRAGKADLLGKVVSVHGEMSYRHILGDDPRLLELADEEGFRLFYADARASDVFGKAVLEPDIVLMDLISIFHPQLLPQYLPTYYQRLGGRS